MSVIPEQFEPAFWSYNIKALDLERDQELIITRLLNYGDWDAVRWVHKAYGEAAIRAVVSQPRRGVWLPRVLNFWLKMLGIELSREKQKRALMIVG